MINSRILTIVVPAFNMQDYIHHCLNSLCVESLMEDVEVIVVNDGSTDDTSVIAHEYERRYPNYFKIIDKLNGNYGSCMNAALPLARGKYFKTLDADDWYDSDAFCQLVADMKSADADIIISEKTNHYEDNPHDIRPYAFPPDLPMCQDISLDSIDWNRPELKEMMGVMFLATKTSLLRKVDMRWSEGVFYTDFEYIMIPLFQAQTVRLVPYPVYQYLLGRTGQSVSLNVSRKNMHSYAVVLHNIMDRCERCKILSAGAASLFRLKQELLVRVIYCLFFHERFVLDTELKSIESRICMDSHLCAFTEGLIGFRGHRYVWAYRHCRPLFYLYCLDYQLRIQALCLKDYVFHH